MIWILNGFLLGVGFFAALIAGSKALDVFWDVFVDGDKCRPPQCNCKGHNSL